MGLFNRNTQNCCCNNINQNTIKKMEKYENSKFIILGSGCDKCTELEKNLKEALKQSNMNEKVDHITDSILISMYGVMQTPALVITGKVVSIGKVLSVDEIIKLIEKNYIDD